MENDIYTHVIFVTAFIRKGRKFLLARRDSDDPQAGGQWSTPGGKVDLDVEEMVIENTLQREILEEVGIRIQPGIDYLGSESFIRTSGHHVVGLVFLADWKSGIARPLEGQSEIAWYSLDELLSLQFPDYLVSRISLLADKLRKTG